MMALRRATRDGGVRQLLGTLMHSWLDGINKQAQSRTSAALPARSGAHYSSLGPFDVRFLQASRRKVFW